MRKFAFNFIPRAFSHKSNEALGIPKVLLLYSVLQKGMQHFILLYFSYLNKYFFIVLIRYPMNCMKSPITTVVENGNNTNYTIRFTN